MPSPTLSDIAAILNCPSPRDANRTVTGISNLDQATASELPFLGSEKYLPDFEKTRPAPVIVQKRVNLPPIHNKPVLLADDPNLAVPILLSHFPPPTAPSSAPPASAAGPRSITSSRSATTSSLVHIASLSGRPDWPDRSPSAPALFLAGKAPSAITSPWAIKAPSPPAPASRRMSIP